MEEKIKNKQDVLSNPIMSALDQKLKQRIREINYDQESFGMVYHKNESERTITLAIRIMYHDESLALFNYSIPKPSSRIMATGIFVLYRLSDSNFMSNYTANVYIQADGSYKFRNQTMSIDEILDILLPLADSQHEEKITTELERIGIKSTGIAFDTVRNVYVIEYDLASFFSETERETSPSYYYKYMSLDTFLCVLKSQKIRLNSIISMNDSSELFFMGDTLCDEYSYYYSRDFQLDANTIKRKKTVQYKDCLITSLTSKGDDALMWRLYGDNGRGVCLCFLSETPIRPIRYINENSKLITSLRGVIAMLGKLNIHFVFKDLDKYELYTKSSQFEYETEYRLLRHCDPSEVELARYGNTLAMYRDYAFNEVALQLTSIIVGSNLPNKDINFPIIASKAKEVFDVDIVDFSRVNKLRL